MRESKCEERTDRGPSLDAQRILLADDDPDSLEGMRSLLMAWGYDVETAENGRAALDKVGVVHPSVVITDVVMPAMSGLELLEAVRRHEPDVHVIVMTAHDSSDTRRRAAAHGAFAYLPKPVDAARLKSLLARALGEEGGVGSRH
jgi:DNA-binding NtrC family response regulator